MNRSIALSALLVLLSGCGGVSGDYGGEECIYDKMTFKSDGTVYLTMLGMEQAGTFETDDDRVIVTMNGQSFVFTDRGDALTASILGEEMVCEPL